MRSVRLSNVPDKPSLNRHGLLYLGAVAEIAVICLAVAVVLITIFQAKMMRQTDSPLQLTLAEHVNEQPILGMIFDRDHQSLIVHHWPDDLEEINLDSGVRTRRKKPEQLVSMSASTTNSTIAYLTERASDNQLRHELYVMRGPDLVLFDELEFELAASGTVRTSYDGSIVIVVSHGGTVYGWDLTSPVPVQWTYCTPLQPTLSLLSPDGKSLLIAAENGNLRLYDARAGMIRQAFSLQQDFTRTGAWSADSGRLAVGDQRGAVSVFDVQTGERLWHHKVDELFARSLAFSNDGTQIAIGTFDKAVRIWNITEPDTEPIELQGESSTIHNMVFLDADSKLICGGQDGSIREWDLASREVLRKLK